MNYSKLSETFSSFSSLKGTASGDQHFPALAKDISQAFQSNSLAKQQELDLSIDRLKEPIDEYRLMIEAAIDACLRRRKLVFKYYEGQEHLMFAARASEGFDQQRMLEHAEMTKRLEAMKERVQESTKCLDDELR